MAENTANIKPIFFIFIPNINIPVIIAPTASTAIIIELNSADLPSTSTAINGAIDCWGNINKFIIIVPAHTARTILLFLIRLE